MNEEVSLPLHSPHVHTLYTIGLFVSQSKAVITSVVVLLDDVSILGGLDAASGKVAHVFDCPPEVLLDPELAHSEKLVPVRSEDWPYEAELYVKFQGQLLDRHDYRLHRFQSTASPIKGLMADILIATARIAYAREPVFQRWGPGQLKTFEGIQQAVEAAALAAAASRSHPTLSHGHVAPTTTIRA